jgi:hypothetical protein
MKRDRLVCDVWLFVISATEFLNDITVRERQERFTIGHGVSDEHVRRETGMRIVL